MDQDIQTREELTTLRRENRESLTLIEKHQEISTHLLENASRETEIRMGLLEEKLRSNRELSQEEFLLLRRSLKRDPEKVRKMILSPSIQVTAQSGVGGGTVIGSRRKNENEYEIYIITAFHVLGNQAAAGIEGFIDFGQIGGKRRYHLACRRGCRFKVESMQFDWVARHTAAFPRA